MPLPRTPKEVVALAKINRELAEVGIPYNWYISPPYVARARQMPSLRRGLIAKGGL